jgi:hypothetical protein
MDGRVALGDQQRRVVELIADGCDTEMIAEELSISPETVREKVRRMCAYFGVRMIDLPCATGVSDCPEEASCEGDGRF